MDQSIVGYHRDDENDWVAELACGHFQHVRHNPPLVERPWVVTEPGRASMLGHKLACAKCDVGAPTDGTMLDRAIQLRRALHQNPELSGCEVQTARRIFEFFEPLRPDAALENLGGHGLAFVFSGPEMGPTVLLRCELDALPIAETNTAAHRSTHKGVSHQCGHDGHMAVLATVGGSLAAHRPRRGRVVLLYQPAEETGEGATAVLRDPRFTEIAPDFVFALHNLPGFPLGQVVVRAGAFSCASRGVAICLTGTSAHAAQPETGVSPSLAMCQLIEELSSLAPAGGEEIAFATVVGARLGEMAFGTAPGHAEVWATLRSETDETMGKMMARVEDASRRVASLHGLKHSIEYRDVFSATVNSVDAVDVVRHACKDGSILEIPGPFRWSEDFGRFTATANGAMFGIGAGVTVPDLHHPAYDFPDELIGPAAAVLLRIADKCLGPDRKS